MTVYKTITLQVTDHRLLIIEAILNFWFIFEFLKSIMEIKYSK